MINNDNGVPLYQLWWRWFLHWMQGCYACRVHETPYGIGGKCTYCGKIHGWVTRDELRAYADRELNK